MNVMKLRTRGFTIVELLIVIVVIVILAAITLVVYNNLQNQGYDSAVQSDLDNVTPLVESYRLNDPTNTAKEFPHTSAVLATLGIRATKGSYDQTIANNFVFCVSPSSDSYQSYAIVAMSKSGSVFVVTQDGLYKKPITTIAASDFGDSSALCHALDDKGITSIDMGRVSAGMLGAGSWQSWVQG